MTAALLTLADSRLPAGGHTHSGGVEQAIAAGVVHDPASLAAFLRRRLATSGAVAAGLAAAACRRSTPPTRSLSWPGSTPRPTPGRRRRRCGRRPGSRAAGSSAWDAAPGRRPRGTRCPAGPTTRSRSAWPPRPPGCGPRDAAQAAAYLSISGPATAAQRLLAMDPLTVAAVTARLAPRGRRRRRAAVDG